MCENIVFTTKLPKAVLYAQQFLLLKYRQLSLSQSPGDQTKYFELSVVWDSQFVTSFTLYMYTDCLDHRDYNLHVHVFGNDVLEFKYPLTESLISNTNFGRLWQKLKNVYDYLLQRTPLNSVQSLKLQRVQSDTPDCVIVLTISVITEGQLNVNSWLSMSLRFIGV